MSTILPLCEVASEWRKVPESSRKTVAEHSVVTRDWCPERPGDAVGIIRRRAVEVEARGRAPKSVEAVLELRQLGRAFAWQLQLIDIEDVLIEQDQVGVSAVTSPCEGRAP